MTPHTDTNTNTNIDDRLQDKNPHGNRKARRRQLAELKATGKFTAGELRHIKGILKK